ncbi:hypothetical protein IMSAG013_00265 [Clostridiales bacterium]|nr:hypothetical protein IMSAG013_00265 [Clostridiales bacterium]
METVVELFILQKVEQLNGYRNGMVAQVEINRMDTAFL